MSQFPQSRTKPFELDYGTDNKAVFNFFNAVYAWMAAGLGVTAAVAYMVSHSPEMLKLMYSNKFMPVAMVLGAWGIAYAVQSVAMRIGAGAATALFLLYAAVIGCIFSGIFLIYPISTIGAAFLITGGTFAAMSIYGFVTKRDLTTMGSYLVMAFFGLFFASIANVFFANNAMSWVITYGVLAVFIGITAYQTQKLKHFALESAHNADLAARVAIIGSLMLYGAFINMFMSILRIMGSRK